MSSSFTKKTSFCAAPWIHAHVAADGQRRLCCVADEFAPQPKWESFSDFKNGETMKRVRREMMNGVLPAECKACTQTVRSDVYRDTFNTRYSHLLHQVEQTTSEDGGTTMKPVFIDYRTDICNLMCRTCVPFSSTQLQSHMGKFKSQYEAVGIRNIPPMSLPEKKSLHVQNLRELDSLLSSEILEEVYFAGGEPTLNPGHLQSLAILAKNSQSQNITIYYNTNLTISKDRLVAWLTALAPFKEVKIHVSIDGHGEVAEYVRSGLSWSDFQEKLEFAMKHKAANTRLVIDPTITSLFMLQLKEFSDFCLNHKLPILAKAMVGNNINDHLRVEFLPRKLRQQLIEEWKVYYSSKSKKQQSLLTDLANVLLICLSLEEIPESQFPVLYKTFTQLDRLHNHGSFEDLLKLQPAVNDWFVEQKSRIPAAFSESHF